MMAEHGKPCDPQEATFCMNEGTCYKLPAMNTLSCICSENYKGNRCEQYHLPSSSQDEYDRGLLAAIIVVVIILLVVLVVIIYYVQKMVKEKSNRKNHGNQKTKFPLPLDASRLDIVISLPRKLYVISPAVFPKLEMREQMQMAIFASAALVYTFIGSPKSRMRNFKTVEVFVGQLAGLLGGRFSVLN